MAGSDGTGQTPADAVAASVSARVHEIMEQAERSALQVRSEVEAQTARRAAETRVAADEDAEKVRRAAEEQAVQYVSDARRRADDYATGRQRRIDDLTDELTERAHALQRRLDEAFDIHGRLQETIEALGEAKRAVRAEAQRPPADLPPLKRPDAAGQQVRAVAEDLPERLRRRTNLPTTPVAPPETADVVDDPDPANDPGDAA